MPNGTLLKAPVLALVLFSFCATLLLFAVFAAEGDQVSERYKSIEIYYDIGDIPGISDRSGFSAEALDFRNAAMEHIEAALEAAGAGAWAGAEVGGGGGKFRLLCG